MAKKYNLEESLEFRKLQRYADSITSHDRDAELESILQEFTKDRERYERTAPKPAPSIALKRESVKDEKSFSSSGLDNTEDTQDFLRKDDDVKPNVDFERETQKFEVPVNSDKESEQKRKAELLDLAFGPASANNEEESLPPEVLALIDKAVKKDAADSYAEILSETSNEPLYEESEKEESAFEESENFEKDDEAKKEPVYETEPQSEDEDYDDEEYEDDIPKMGFFARMRARREARRLEREMEYDEDDEEDSEDNEFDEIEDESEDSEEAVKKEELPEITVEPFEIPPLSLDKDASDKTIVIEAARATDNVKDKAEDSKSLEEEHTSDKSKRNIDEDIDFIKEINTEESEEEISEFDYEEDEEDYAYYDDMEYADPETTMCDADEYDEVYDALSEQCSHSMVRIVVSAIAFALLCFISIFDFFGMVLPGALGTNGDKIYAGISIVLLAVVIIMNFGVMKLGAKTLVSKGKQQGVSLVFLSTVIISVHSVYSFIRCLINGDVFVSYASAVALAMLLYSIGRRIYDGAHIKNFEEIYNAASSITEVKNVSGEELTKIANKFSSLGENFYYKDNVGSTGGFLSHARGGEREVPIGTRLTVIILAVTVALSVLISLLRGFEGGFDSTFMLFVAMFAMVMPTMFELTGSLVFAKSAGHARAEGAIISGTACARKHSEVEAVLLDDCDIFRKGTVVIKGLKLIDSSVINTIIPDVASIFVTIDSPAKYAFLDIIDNKTNMLKQVSFYEKIDDEGLLALVDGAKIMLGNRDFMVKQGVVAPEDETKYFKQGKSRFNMYVALNGRLVCVFSMGYMLDRGVGASLLELESEDVRSVIATFDPNLTELGLRRLFLISQNELKLMHPQDVIRFKELSQSEDKIGRSGLYLTKKSAVSFAALIRALKAVTFSTRTNRLLMIVAMVGAPILLSLIAILNDMTQIAPFTIVLLQLLWNVPVWINSAFSK